MLMPSGVVLAAGPAGADNWIDFGGGAPTGSFGANAEVRIDGRLVYEDDCPKGGLDDFVYPASDVYVVGGDVAPGAKLVDVGGGRPNTIVSTTSMFLGEIIAITAPSGKLGDGTYGVVFDTCQDGSFDPGLDTVFPDAFTVALPAVLPLVGSAIVDLKAKAHEEWESWKGTHTSMKVIFALAAKGLKAQCRAGNPVACAYKGADVQGAVKEKFLKLLLSQSNHYLAIAEDPPDADFKRLTTLEPEPVPADHTGEALTDAVADALEPLAGEAALNQALLHALERYQGAQVAGDGEWALIHARQARDLSTALAAQLPATTTALTGLRDAVAVDSAAIEDGVAQAREHAGRVHRSGFTPDERRILANQGLTAGEVTALETEVRDINLPDAPSGSVEALDRAVAAHAATGAALAKTAAGLDALISDVEGQAAVPKAAPAARAGGPYTASEGQPLVLDGSGSTTPPGTTMTGYAWDLDGDGAFDDADGARPTVSFPTSGSRVLALRATNSASRDSLSYTTVTVGQVNAPPTLGSATPDAATTTTVVGTPATFTVTATDPEGAPVSHAWTLDGTPVATTPGFTYDPPANHVGIHTVEVTVTDGTAAGGATRRSWDVSVILPDSDRDGWTRTTDCNDTDFAIHPTANELLGNDTDDDCDPGTPDAPPGGLTGTMWSWGANHRGALGTGAPVRSDGVGPIVPTPTEIPGYDDTVQVEGGHRNGYAVRATGEVLAWGDGQSGQLGIGDVVGHSAVPVPPLAVGGGSGRLSSVTQISAGRGDPHVIARRTDGTVVAWGGNQARQIGDGSTVNLRSHPVEVLSASNGPPLFGVRSVEGGSNNSYAIMDDGSLKSWGAVRCHGRSDWAPTPQPFPVPVPVDGNDVREVSEGNNFALILKKDGTVFSCGAGPGGPVNTALLGRPIDSAHPNQRPLPVEGLGPGSGVVAVSAGTESSLALKADGTLWAWGQNSNGALDILVGPCGTCLVPSPRQVPLPPGPPVVAVESDQACHNLAIRADGSILAWGCTFFGQTGTGTSDGAVATPTRVNLPGQFTMALSTSIWNSLALTRPVDDPDWEQPATWVEASVTDAVLTEMGGGAFGVTLSAALPHEVTVDWSLVAGTADVADLALGRGTVTVPAGSTTAAIPVPVTGDLLDEDDEAFTLVLEDVSHGIRRARSQATGTIVDDDDPPAVSVEPLVLGEGNTSLTDAQVAVRLSGPSAKPVTVAYATTDGTATAPGDYAAAAGTVRIPAGRTTGVIHVPVRGDNEVEPDETLTVALSAPVNATLGEASATVRVTDDEVLALSVESPVVQEGTGGITPASFTVSVVPSVPSGTEISVAYRVEGVTATVPDDVAAASGTLRFVAGDGPVQVPVSVAADAGPEANESFRLVLESPVVVGGRRVLGADAPLAVVVDDDDPHNRPPGCGTVKADQAILWPPDHKLRLVTLTGASDPDGDPVTVTVTGVAQDEPVDGLGDGDTGPDAAPAPAAGQVWLRAERSGQGDGRVYRISFTATDTHGATCAGTIAVGVPKSRSGNGASLVDSGPTFDSFG